MTSQSKCMQLNFLSAPTRPTAPVVWSHPFVCMRHEWRQKENVAVQQKLESMSFSLWRELVVINLMRVGCQSKMDTTKAVWDGLVMSPNGPCYKFKQLNVHMWCVKVGYTAAYTKDTVNTKFTVVTAHYIFLQQILIYYFNTEKGWCHIKGHIMLYLTSSPRLGRPVKC